MVDLVSILEARVKNAIDTAINNIIVSRGEMNVRSNKYELSRNPDIAVDTIDFVCNKPKTRYSASSSRNILD